MTFARLTRGDAVAAAAALLLLLVMSLDWYGTARGDDARQIQERVEQRGSGSGEITRNLEETARLTAEGQEKTAWQAFAFTDLLLFAAILAALVAAFARAGGRRFDPPASPSGVAAMLGALAALLVAYRIVQEPGIDSVTTIKVGAFLGLLMAAALGLGALAALRAEQNGTAWPGAGAAPEKPASGVDPSPGSPA